MEQTLLHKILLLLLPMKMITLQLSLQGASFTVAENETAIGTVSATDVDFDGSVTLEYRVSGSEIAIGLNSGELTFVTAPDFETKSSYTATVSVTDGKNTTTQDITVTVIDENDNSPVISSGASFTAAENQTAIGTVSATDVDFDGSVTLEYRVSGSEIAIGLNSGELTFVTAPDFETKSSYTATVSVTDGKILHKILLLLLPMKTITLQLSLQAQVSQSLKIKQQLNRFCN